MLVFTIRGATPSTVTELVAHRACGVTVLAKGNLQKLFIVHDDLWASFLIQGGQ